jgi:hypothetical protein
MLGKTRVPPRSENGAFNVRPERALSRLSGMSGVPAYRQAGRGTILNNKSLPGSPALCAGTSHYVSRTKITSILTRYSIIFVFSTATLNSTTRIPVTPLKVFNALENPVRTASSNPLGDPAIISVTLATLGSVILITSFAVRSFT